MFRTQAWLPHQAQHTENYTHSTQVQSGRICLCYGPLDAVELKLGHSKQLKGGTGFIGDRVRSVDGPTGKRPPRLHVTCIIRVGAPTALVALNATMGSEGR